MVCSLFLDRFPFDSSRVVAAAEGIKLESEIELPKNIFITTYVKPSLSWTPGLRVVDELTPATVLHEALHGLTLKSDEQLGRYFAQNMGMNGDDVEIVAKEAARDSFLLSQLIEQFACAPK